MHLVNWFSLDQSSQTMLLFFVSGGHLESFENNKQSRVLHVLLIVWFVRRTVVYRIVMNIDSSQEGSEPYNSRSSSTFQTAEPYHHRVELTVNVTPT